MDYPDSVRVDTLEIERDAPQQTVMDEPSERAEMTRPAPRQTLVREGISPSVDPQSLAKADAVHSPEIIEIATALAIAQGEFDVVEKNKHANVRSRKGDGSSFSYDYEDLASVLRAVRPALSKNGLAMVQLPTTMRGGVSVQTLLVHGPSGQWFRNRFTLACDAGDPQAVGSALTYARRYALKSILGLASEDEDDDGERARVSNVERRAEAPRPAQRKSQQQAPPEPPPALTITGVVTRPNGYIIQLSDGRYAATTDKAMADAAARLSAAHTPVDVTLQPSSDPKKYAPKLEEITPLR